MSAVDITLLTTAPMSIEAEEAALGSILVNPGAYIQLSAILQPEDFWLLRHSRIWQAFMRLNKRQDPIDYLTVAEELKAMNTLEEVGGYPYLIQLMNNTPTSVHAEIYGKLVKRTAIRRQMLEVADKTRGLALDEEQDIEAVLSKAVDGMLAIRTPADNHVMPMSAAAERYYARLEQALAGKAPLGFPTGFRDLDNIMNGLRQGELTILGARPGVGKTSLLLSIVLNAARVGRRVWFSTLEMLTDQLMERIISIEAGINSAKLRTGNLTSQEQSRAVESFGRVSELPIMMDDSSSVTPAQLRSKIRSAKYEHGIDLVVVDYLQLMHPNKSSGERHLDVGSISKELKEISKDYGVHVLAAAQLNRDVEARKDKRPVLSDLRESGNIEADADNVWFIYRDELYNENTEFPNQADVIIAKHRSGATGTVSMYFEKHLTKFMDGNVHRVDMRSLD